MTKVTETPNVVVRQVKTTNGTTYHVRVDGRIVDSRLHKPLAMQTARRYGKVTYEAGPRWAYATIRKE